MKKYSFVLALILFFSFPKIAFGAFPNPLGNNQYPYEPNTSAFIQINNIGGLGGDNLWLVPVKGDNYPNAFQCRFRYGGVTNTRIVCNGSDSTPVSSSLSIGDDIGCYYDGTDIIAYINGSEVHRYACTVTNPTDYSGVYTSIGFSYDSIVFSPPATPTPTSTPTPTPTSTPTPTPTTAPTPTPITVNIGNLPTMIPVPSIEPAPVFNEAYPYLHETCTNFSTDRRSEVTYSSSQMDFINPLNLLYFNPYNGEYGTCEYESDKACYFYSYHKLKHTFTTNDYIYGIRSTFYTRSNNGQTYGVRMDATVSNFIGVQKIITPSYSVFTATDSVVTTDDYESKTPRYLTSQELSDINTKGVPVMNLANSWSVNQVVDYGLNTICVYYYNDIYTDSISGIPPSDGYIPKEKGSTPPELDSYGCPAPSGLVDFSHMMCTIDKWFQNIIIWLFNPVNSDLDIASFFDDISVSLDTNLTSIITAPLDTIEAIATTSCSSLTLPLPNIDGDLVLPCPRSLLSSQFSTLITLWDVISTGLISYWVIVRIFATVKRGLNPDDDKIEIMDI